MVTRPRNAAKESECFLALSRTWASSAIKYHAATVSTGQASMGECENMMTLTDRHAWPHQGLWPHGIDLL